MMKHFLCALVTIVVYALTQTEAAVAPTLTEVFFLYRRFYYIVWFMRRINPNSRHGLP